MTKTDTAWDAIKAAYPSNFMNNLSSTFTNNPTWLNTMMNRIGLTRCYGVDNYEHPFVKYNRGVLDMGDTVQTYKVKKVNPKLYSADDETNPFTVEKNAPIAQYAILNVSKKYKTSITEEQIAKAFTDGAKLGSFVEAELSSMMESDAIDQYTEWKQYLTNINTPSVKVELEDDIYNQIRSIAMEFRTPSTAWNDASDVAVTTGGIDIILTKEKFIEVGNKLGGVYHPDYIALDNCTIRWVDDFATRFDTRGYKFVTDGLIFDERALNRWVRTPRMWNILNSETGVMNYVYKFESLYCVDKFRNFATIQHVIPPNEATE